MNNIKTMVLLLSAV